MNRLAQAERLEWLIRSLTCGRYGDSFLGTDAQLEADYVAATQDALTKSRGKLRPRHLIKDLITLSERGILLRRRIKGGFSYEVRQSTKNETPKHDRVLSLPYTPSLRTLEENLQAHLVEASKYEPGSLGYRASVRIAANVLETHLARWPRSLEVEERLWRMLSDAWK
ncbi:hypothetical protein [Caballeronia sp. LZ001]|uniref:hypothetical protein n=1 Tax=Caballeronia sp. LZ001 TaxID=3038553 RepID=UPI002860EB4E|nr:hypothetical protein [Caballeronia sp. LZ001]MDR5806558.1 hypothetical protein [Caballeronia sp. LZ001]